MLPLPLFFVPKPKAPRSGMGMLYSITPPPTLSTACPSQRFACSSRQPTIGLACQTACLQSLLRCCDHMRPSLNDLSSFNNSNWNCWDCHHYVVRLRTIVLYDHISQQHKFQSVLCFCCKGILLIIHRDRLSLSFGPFELMLIPGNCLDYSLQGFVFCFIFFIGLREWLAQGQPVGFVPKVGLELKVP